MTATNNFGGFPQEFGRHNFSRVSSQRVLQREAIVQELDYLVNQVGIGTLMSCTQYVLRWHWHADRLERLVFCSITICIAVWNGVTSYGINRDLMHQTSCVPTGMEGINVGKRRYRHYEYSGISSSIKSLRLQIICKPDIQKYHCFMRFHEINW